MRNRFGVELERFLLSPDGRTPNSAEIEAFYSTLRAASKGDQAPKLHAAFERNGVSADVKPDFCESILEVAYSPCETPAQFLGIYQIVEEHLRRALAATGLVLEARATLSEPPSGVTLAASPSDCNAVRLQKLVGRPLPPKALAHPLFMAAICSTQVSLDAGERAIDRLDGMYEFEYLVPLGFSHGGRFMGAFARCVRTFVYWHNFDSGYVLCGFPSVLPRSTDDYAQIRARHDFIRDYSLIAASASRLEFRGADSLGSPDEIVELAALRMIQCSVVQGARRPVSDPREDYVRACLLGTATEDQFTADMDRLEEEASCLPGVWLSSGRGALNRIRAGINSLSERYVVPALTDEELLGALRLRYDVFAMEQGDTRYADQRRKVHEDDDDRAGRALTFNVRTRLGVLAGSARMTLLRDHAFIAHDVFDWERLASVLRTDTRSLLTRVARLDRVCIAREFRGTGVLKQLVDEIVAAAVSRGATVMVGIVGVENDRSKRAFEKLGWRTYGVIGSARGVRCEHIYLDIS